jgi:hypothetical protein
MLWAVVEPSRHRIINHAIGRKKKRAQLEQFEFLESLIVRCDAQIEKASAPFTESTELLQAPGIGELATEVIVNVQNELSCRIGGTQPHENQFEMGY